MVGVPPDEALKRVALEEVENCKTLAELERVRVRWLGRKGFITRMLRDSFSQS